MVLSASRVAAQAGTQAGEVRVGAKTAFFIDASVGSFSPEDRAEIANRRIAKILTDPKLDPSHVRVSSLPDGTPVVALDNFVVLESTPAGAAASGMTIEQLTQERARILREEITQLKPLYQQRQASIKTLSQHRVLLLILQVALLLLMARVCGELMARLGQPPVIGQLLAGILLGRSIFGVLFPDMHALVFPVETTQSYLLEVISWLGVIFLLMLTGMETDLALIRQQGRSMLWASLLGISIPFLLGLGIGYVLPARLLVTSDQRLLLALFLGTALAVSSVPVIAKILMDMNLLRRNIGQVTLAAALAHDTTSWIILALVAGLASSGTFSVWVVGKALIGTLLFGVFCLTIGQRWVAGLLRWVNDRATGEYSLLTAVVLLALLSAGITQWIGVHAVLGAFLMGVVLSNTPLIGRKVIQPIEAVTNGIFAPIFFAAAGLQVNLNVLATPSLLGITFLVVSAACLGKVTGGYLGGRLGGMPPWEALSLGLGTNARGAMGLIVGILGFSLGLLTVDMFSVVIIMAVITTAMAPPLLTWSLRHVHPSPEEQARLKQEEQQASSFLRRLHRVLLATRGGPDAALAGKLLGVLGQNQSVEITALQVVTPGQQEVLESDLLSQMGNLESARLSAVPRTLCAATAAEGILQEAQHGYDLLALGCGHDIASVKKVFGAVVDRVAVQYPAPMLVVRAFPEGSWPPQRILLPTTGAVHSAPAAEWAIALAHTLHIGVTALCVVEEHNEMLFWPAHAYEAPTVLAEQVVSQVAALAEPFGVEVDAQVRVASHAAVEIVRIANAQEDSLILFSGSPRPTQQLYFGSTVSYVLRQARCHVAIIKP